MSPILDIPSGASLSGASQLSLKGFKSFVRHNPLSDRFTVIGFHSIEFWCSDATNTYKRFQHGLGMSLVNKSDQSTGNTMFASYVLKSNDLVFTFTAPYSRVAWQNGMGPTGKVPLPHYDQQEAHDFIATHGLAVRAVGEHGPTSILRSDSGVVLGVLQAAACCLSASSSSFRYICSGCR